MKNDIYYKLIELTEEEQQVLEGKEGINKKIYTDKSQFIIDSEKLLKEGEFIHIRKHTRFIDFPAHRHNFIEFNYVYQGELTQIIEGRKIELKQGEIIFLNQHITHELKASSKEDIIINFIIRPEFFDYIISLFENDTPVINFLISTLYTGYNNGEYLYFKVAQNKEIQSIIEKIIVELYDDDIVSNAKIKLLVGLLLVELVKNVNNIDEYSANNYEKKIIIEVIKYIDKTYKNATLVEISNKLNQSDYKMSKLIKKHTGKTFKELLKERRLAKSEELLVSTSLSIIEIVEEVGYENLTYFYKIFKEKNNIRPKEYREKGKLS